MNSYKTGSFQDIGSARTGITYQDALAERELRKNLNRKSSFGGRKRGMVPLDSPVKENSAMQVTSDIVLTAGLLGGSQENLTRGLMFQVLDFVIKSFYYNCYHMLFLDLFFLYCTC